MRINSMKFLWCVALSLCCIGSMAAMDKDTFGKKGFVRQPGKLLTHVKKGLHSPCVQKTLKVGGGTLLMLSGLPFLGAGASCFGYGLHMIRQGMCLRGIGVCGRSIAFVGAPGYVLSSWGKTKITEGLEMGASRARRDDLITDF